MERRGAAALLRHYLEYKSAELCHRLPAPVAFRGDGRYQLSDLLSCAVGELGALYRAAKNTAQSWGDKETLGAISAREAEFKKVAAASRVEEWQANAAVHYNGWANLVKEDFFPVVEAFKALLASFICASCGEYVQISPERERAELLRCGCSKTNFNLLKKPTPAKAA